jgi:hypothetical protein
MIDRQRLLVALSGPHWLFAALAAAVFIQFALNRGGVEPAIWTAGALLIAQVATGAYRPWELPLRDLAVVAVVALALVSSWLVAPEASDAHRGLRLVKLVILVLAVRQLAALGFDRRHVLAAAVIACAIVAWQLTVRLAVGSPYGTFANPHFLAFFAALLLPALLMLARSLRSPLRHVVYLCALLDLWLIFNESTRPTIPLLSLSAAAAAVAWSAAGVRVRWLAAGALSALLCFLLLAPDAWLASLGLITPAQDERVRLWSDSWRLIAAGDLRAWLLGHGIGTLRSALPGGTIPEFVGLTMPHNHLLALLYENGAVIAAIVTGAIGAFLVQSLRLPQRLADAPSRALARANLAATAIWLVFSFLAFDTYSRHTLYPLGYLLGIHLHLASRVAGNSPAFDTPPATGE